MPKKGRGPSDPCKPFYDSVADMEEIVLSEKESGCISELEGLLDELEGLELWREAQPIIVKFRKKHKFAPKKNALLHVHRRRGKVTKNCEEFRFLGQGLGLGLPLSTCADKNKGKGKS